MNKLFQQLNQSKSLSLPNNIRQMINTVKMAHNPQAAIQQMVNSNPQLRSALQMAGGDPEKAFKTMAKQVNVNPDEIMNMLK